MEATFGFGTVVFTTFFGAAFLTIGFFGAVFFFVAAFFFADGFVAAFFPAFDRAGVVDFLPFGFAPGFTIVA